MEWQDLLTDGYGRVPEFMERVLDGLNQEDLNWQPRQDCNSIGWLCWHLTRAQDAMVASLMGEGQLWTEDGWHAKFNRPPDDKDGGFGHTPEQVSAFESPDAQTVLDYQRVVVERAKGYLQTLSKTDLDRKLEEPMSRLSPNLGGLLVGILVESLLHAGQAAYVRGLHQGEGWQRF